MNKDQPLICSRELVLFAKNVVEKDFEGGVCAGCGRDRRCNKVPEKSVSDEEEEQQGPIMKPLGSQQLPRVRWAPVPNHI